MLLQSSRLQVLAPEVRAFLAPERATVGTCARALTLALPLLLLSLLSFAQTPPPSTFRGSTSLVVVDVVVADKTANPIANLEAADSASQSSHADRVNLDLDSTRYAAIM